MQTTAESVTINATVKNCMDWVTGIQAPSGLKTVTNGVAVMGPGQRAKRWTVAEEEFLRANLNTLSNPQLAAALDLSLDTVKMKVRKMMKDEGIRRQNFKASPDLIDGEVWQRIPDYPDYEVSDYGRVRKNSENGLFQVAFSYNPHGYVQVGLTANGVRKTKRVARLVAECFIPRIEGKLQVNHIDGNKENNHFRNLEWCTPSENIKHAFDTGLNIPHDRRGTSWKLRVTVIQVREICRRISAGERNLDICQTLNLGKTSIVSQIRRRKTWSHISVDYQW
jgi:DNA-binding CsgD family transcriptional regulator